MQPLSQQDTPQNHVDKQLGKTAPIKVMIVDDHEMLRSALALALHEAENLVLVGEASNGIDAIELCGQLHPDVVLMDIVMDGMDGISATRAIRAAYPSVQVVILTSFKEGNLANAALTAGAATTLFKNVPVDQVMGAIRTAYQHGLNASPPTFPCPYGTSTPGH